MKFLIIGSGAIGLYVGGSLAKAGYETSFISRGDAFQAIQSNGIKLDIIGKTTTIQTPVVYPDVGSSLLSSNFDLVILAIKAYHVKDFLEEIQQISDKFPPVLCLLNGVESEEVLGAILGYKNVIAGKVTTAVEKPALNKILVRKVRGVGIGSSHLICSEILNCFESAELNPRLFRNPEDMKWSKLISNLMANASSAIVGMPARDIYAHSGLFNVEILQIKEALSVMKALGLHPVNLPGVPVKWLSFLILVFPKLILQKILIKKIGDGRGNKPPSLQLDLLSGKKDSEVNFLNGAVANYGEKVGVVTPINSQLTSILLSILNGTIHRSTYLNKPDILAKELLSKL